MSSEFIKFVLASGTAAACNILARWFLSSFMSFEVSVVIAYLIGMTVAFVLNRRFVFGKSERHVRSEAARFTLVNLLALMQVWVVSVALANWIFPAIGLVWQPELIAHVVGVISPIGTSFLGHKKYTFG